MTPGLRLLLLGLLLALLTPLSAQAESAEAKVVDLRGRRVYLEVERGGPFEAGGQVTLRAGDQEVRGTLVAASTRYLLVEVPEGASLEADQTVSVTGRARPSPPRAEAGPPRPTGKSQITIGRRTPSLQEWLRQAPKERELVPFRRAERLEGDARPTPDGEEPPPQDAPPQLEDNQVRGGIEVGFDGAYQDKGDTDRTTPYARLRLEVRRLGGSDRASLLFYGSVRHPFDGTRDWTGHREEQLNARLSAFALRLEAMAPEQVEGFTDRIELTVGRDRVKDVVEAGAVDGVQLGLRLGPVMPFGFAGFAVSTNPRQEDYDSLIWGGGLRFAKAFEHSGAIRLSVAASIERFRDANERGFVEARGDVRYGGLGVRGALVYDIFSSLEDDRRNRVTTGELIVYDQLTPWLRVEGGYRERRPVYTAELIENDLRRALSVTLVPGALPGDPPLQAVADLVEESARRNIWLTSTLLFDAWDLRVRGEHYQARESRDHTGAEVEVGLRNLAKRDRLALAIAFRHRLRGNGIRRHSTEPYLRLSYHFLGESVRWLLNIAYRFSNPEEVGERRLALRLAVDGDLYKGLGLRAYAQGDFLRDSARNDDTLFLVGAALRYRF